MATISQPITVQAGTGVLLRLPQPAATVMSAEPGVARVQPASPTSLFLMGVAPGRTTVIATTDAGAGDRPVRRDRRPGAGGAAACRRGRGRHHHAGDGIARSRRAIARTVQGASAVRVQGAGSRRGPDRHRAERRRRPAGRGDRARLRRRERRRGGQPRPCWAPSRSTSGSASRKSTARSRASSASTGRRSAAATAGASACGPAPPPRSAHHAAAAAWACRRSPAPLPPNQLGAGFTSGNKLWDVNGIIDALAADQLITILAEPNLTAQSGETASFLAGGEFPIPIAGNTSNGATTITVEFKTFGVSLAVVPTVLSPTRLNLRVRPEVSQLTTNGAVSVPVGRRHADHPGADSAARRDDGRTGQRPELRHRRAAAEDQPRHDECAAWIGEVPVIGALFKSNDFQRGESELVIIVTPYVVQPASSPTALQTPMDGFRPATDLDRILFGRQLAPAPAGRSAAGCRLHPEVRNACTASVWLIGALLVIGLRSDLTDPYRAARDMKPSRRQ